MQNSKSQLDIVLFGASGFTGSYCIESLHRLTKANSLCLTWGIAGRSEKKLKDTLNECQNAIGADLSTIPIIIADIRDFESLKIMTASAKVVVNCCGPFRLYGEPVVKACIETGTHQVDITGEHMYMDSIEEKYCKAAEEKGVYIVSACGCESIPVDLGVLFLEDKFEGTVNSVETYLEILFEHRYSTINYGTYESFVYALGERKNGSPILGQKLHIPDMPLLYPKLKTRSCVHKNTIINRWCFPSIAPDRSIALRTQLYLLNNRRKRPVQVQTYAGWSSFLVSAFMAIATLIFVFLTQFEWGKNLLLEYPFIFSAGSVKKSSPLKSTTSTMKFVLTLLAEGWNEKLAGASDKLITPPNKKLAMRLSAVDPGYAFTANVVALSAIMILSESSKMPKKGGVYTPGIAFGETSLMKKAQENGLKIEML